MSATPNATLLGNSSYFISETRDRHDTTEDRRVQVLRVEDFVAHFLMDGVKCYTQDQYIKLDPKP